MEKIKVSSAEIVVHGTREKSYYEIKYHDLSDGQCHVGYSSYNLDFVFGWLEECFEIVREAADTIESLSAKLQAANMEWSADCGGWIPCNAENLPDEEVLCCDNHGEMILGFVFEDETSDTGFSAESVHEYMRGCVKWMEKPNP